MTPTPKPETAAPPTFDPASDLYRWSVTALREKADAFDRIVALMRDDDADDDGWIELSGADFVQDVTQIVDEWMELSERAGR